METFEMKNEFISQFNDSSKASLETLQKFNAMNVAAMEKLAALQFSLTTLNVESTVEQAKLFADAKTPEAIIEAESALAKSYGEKFIEITNEANSVITDSREQFVAFAGKTFQAAAPANDATKPAAKTSKKKTTKKAAKKG